MGVMATQYPIALFHQGREIAPYPMDNDDGTFTVRYADNGDIAVVADTEITFKAREDCP